MPENKNPNNLDLPYYKDGDMMENPPDDHVQRPFEDIVWADEQLPEGWDCDMRRVKGHCAYCGDPVMYDEDEVVPDLPMCDLCHDGG